MKVKREDQVLGVILDDSMMMRFQHKRLGEIVDMSDIRAAKIISAPRVTGISLPKVKSRFLYLCRNTEQPQLRFGRV